MNVEIRERIAQVRRGGVPEGYQKTNPYMLPIDWSIQKMGAISKRVARPNKEDADLPAFSINNQQGFIPQSEQFEEGSYADLDKTAYKIVKRGEFAYNPARINVGSMGRLKDVEKVIVSSLYVCLHLDDKQCDGTCFENWFDTYDFYKEIVRNLEGSVREYLFYENFSNIRAPLPPLPEQRKIAEILTQCDMVIDLKKQLIQEKRRQKKWLMQNLLNPDSGVRLPGFCGLWIASTLGSLGSFKNGINKSEDDFGFGVPFINLMDVLGGENAIMNTENLSLVNANENEKEMYKLMEGDVLFVRSSVKPEGVGLTSVIDCDLKNTVYSGFIIRYREKNLSKDFKKYCFRGDRFRKELLCISTISANTNINQDSLSNLVIQYPADIMEQIAIANALSAADREIDLLEQELAQWQTKKKALMQLLLTGIVRVC